LHREFVLNFGFVEVLAELVAELERLVLELLGLVEGAVVFELAAEPVLVEVGVRGQLAELV